MPDTPNYTELIHKEGARIRMVKCLGHEPDPPTDPMELQVWCNKGFSARPVQTHLNDLGTVLWINDDQSVCVQFDDGDERLLWPDEIAYL